MGYYEEQLEKREEMKRQRGLRKMESGYYGSGKSDSIKKDIDKHFLACVASGDIYSEPCDLFRLDINHNPDLKRLDEVWE